MKKGAGALQEVVERSLYNTPEGAIVVVRSSGGVHILKVTGAKTYKTAMVGEVGRSVAYSSDTENEVYNEAYKFAAASREGDLFSENSEAAGYIKRISDDLKEGETALPGMENARDIIRWAFNDETEIGNVSEVIGIDDKYIVAQLVDVKKEGLAELQSVRIRLENDTRIAKKAEILKKRIQAVLDGTKTIEQIALSLGAIVNDAPNTVFSNPNLPFVGNDPALVGAIMGSETNKVLGPIETANGVYVFVVNSREENEFKGDLMAERSRMIEQSSSEVSGRAFEALKKMADMKDYRYKFF